MGFLKKINRSIKSDEKEKQKDFEDRLQAFLKELTELSNKYRIRIRPFISKYGAELEFRNVPPKSEIITPKSGIIVPK